MNITAKESGLKTRFLPNFINRMVKSNDGELDDFVNFNISFFLSKPTENNHR
ncbi:hypothetical protein [Subsaximicrobium wynnwilliamsii]|uniref:hypothetical protein n=1 Tax=Subsaximicrobium wynnwilliamsii TaxID=291179 RepID=UPI001679C501|nr:hypothetical protein [Subsaximicrobium wynnwilliamsii]